MKNKDIIDLVYKNKEKIMLGFKLKNPSLIPIITNKPLKRASVSIKRKELNAIIENYLSNLDYLIDKLDNILISDSNRDIYTLKKQTLETLYNIQEDIKTAVNNINRKEG